MAKHLMEDLTVTPTSLDMSLFFKGLKGKLSGLTGVYVDDTLGAGNDVFLKEANMTQEKFESRAREFDNFTFAGMEVSTIPEGIKLHQEKYAQSIPLAVRLQLSAIPLGTNAAPQWLVTHGQTLLLLRTE